VLEADATRTRIADAAALLHPVRRINVFGIGPSAALARYAAMLLSRTGRPARSLDEAGLSLADQMLALETGEGLLVFAYGQTLSRSQCGFPRGSPLEHAYCPNHRFGGLDIRNSSTATVMLLGSFRRSATVLSGGMQ